MPTSRTVVLPLLLYAFVIMVGVLMDRVNGDFTFVSRREAMTVCPKGYCHDVYSSTGQELPNCCVNPANVLYCTNLKFDSGNCGGCMGKCSPLGGCCNGVCEDNQNDPNNCGGCGFKHPKYQCKAPTPKCVNSKCSS